MAREVSRQGSWQRRQIVLIAISALTLMTSLTAATHNEASKPGTAVAAATAPVLTPALEDLLQRAHQPAPSMLITEFEGGLSGVKRDEKADEDDNGGTESSKEPKSTSDEAIKTKTHSKTTETETKTKTHSSEASKTPTATASNSPLPSAFDGNAFSEFSVSGGSSSCPSFMQRLLTSAEFKKCYPLSMMLQTSTSFFQAEKEVTSLVRVLDATCNVDTATCDTFFSDAAKNLTATANCKQEFDSQQSLVLQAYTGLRAYKVLYTATCLHDRQEDSYCFADAITNLTNPSDAFLYFLPYGLQLPGGSTPSCGYCTSQTMAVFHSTAADRSQAIAQTYANASRQLNTICGPGFVNDTLPKAESSGWQNTPLSLHLMGTVLCSTVLAIAMMFY